MDKAPSVEACCQAIRLESDLAQFQGVCLSKFGQEFVAPVVNILLLNISPAVNGSIRSKRKRSCLDPAHRAEVTQHIFHGFGA